MHRHASLNRMYRLVWSHVRQAWIAVAETARGHGKCARRRLLLAAAVLAATSLAQAGPTGGQVTAGKGSIDQSGLTTTVNQSSQNLSLQWTSFNTGAAETVNFVQPSNSAIAVNRILDTSATRFFGKLNANGQVYVINPNGVLFGAGSQVNVGGLIASTLDIGDGDVSAATRRFTGNGSGSIVNRGSITANDGGYVAFLGQRVINQGTIAAPGGGVALGAGSEVTLSFAGNRLVNMQVDRSTLDNLAGNGGLISADGGAVILSAGARDALLASVVNNTGVIQARSVRAVDGLIVLDGGQHSVVGNSGTLDASGRKAGETGGTVKVLGEQVTLAAGSRIDVAGELGGGSALVGGNFLGAGPERNAQNTTVAAGALVNADALGIGDGGRVAVWSDGSTRFDGRISARGGAAGGNGGSVETSGKHLTVGAQASVATLAPRGTPGDWLLDPQDFTIGGFEPGDGDIDGAQITAALQASNVTIKTGPAVACTNVACNAGQSGNGDIILANGALVGGNDWTSGTTLTLSAYRNVELRGTANIDAYAGTGNIVLRADNGGTGAGTVILSNQSNIFGSASGSVKIYYNPTSYTTPTDYAGLTDMYGDPTIRYANLSSYMLVNLGAAIANKTYDGTAAATIAAIWPNAGLPSGIVIDTSGAHASFASKNAGINKTVTIGGVVMGGANAGLYALNGLDGKTATINKANLTLSGVSANNKTYDGTAAATLSGSAGVSALAGDVVSVTGSGAGSVFANKNAGSGKTVIVNGYSLAGLDAGNYNLVMPAGLTAGIGKASLTVTGVSAVSKTYDGTAAASLAGSAQVSAFGSDVVSVAGSGNASFADKNAGSGKAVAVSGYTLAGADAGNYTIVQPAGLSATINKASLALSGLSAANKTYDGTLAATLSGSATVSALGSDVVGVAGSGSASFADKNAGNGKAVTVGGFSLTGPDAGNYNLVMPAGLTANIGKASLALSGLSANGKTYDGTAAATLSGSAGVSAFGGDVVSVAGSGSASFTDKNVGSGKAVTVTGYTLAGPDAGNYQLVTPAGLSASIGKANLALTGLSANNKTYDGTLAATLSGSASVNAFGADVVTIGGCGCASFADKNAGSGKAVTVSGFTLGGADAGNYNLVMPTGLTASIGKANLALTGVTANDKTYDGTLAATLAGSAHVNAFGADVVSVAGSGSASFTDKNAGSGKAVTVGGYTLAGADAGNYNLVMPGGLTASIGKASLALAGLSANAKTYDGTLAATLSGSASVSAFGADVVSVTGSGSASFTDKHAGSGKAVFVSGYSLTGPDAGNYTLLMPAGLTADIAKASLALLGLSANNKTYDGTAAATLGGSATVAALGGDEVGVTGSASASFTDKNAGSGKAVSVSGYALSGADAGNYALLMPAGLTADIGRANLALTGLSAADKTYDASLAATLVGSATVSAFGSDDVRVAGSGSASFTDKHAGSGKAVSVSGYTLDGADAGNYNLIQPSGLSANIGKAGLLLSGLVANHKTYDGTSAASLSGSATVTPIGSDVVSLSGSANANFADKNAGSGKAVLVGGYSLAGPDAGNYELVMPAGLHADIGRASLAVSGLSAVDKTYDGGTAASLTGSAGVAAFGNDLVLVAGTPVAAFADKNVGTSKAVSVSGFVLAGLDAGNYDIVQPAGLRAAIGKAALAVTGLAAADKTYDGATGAALLGQAGVAAFGNDDVRVVGSGSAAFADRHAGSDKLVTVSGYALDGADAGNYAIVQPQGLRASIGKTSLVLGGLAAGDKVYDGTLAASLSGSAGISALSGDEVSVTGNGTGSFADKHVGSDKAVSVSGYRLTGLDAGNYELLMPAGLRAAITPARLVVSGIVAANKTYDGGTTATVSTAGVVLDGRIGADSVSVASTGVFADAEAGAGKTVLLTNRYGGADAGNYTIVDQATALASIAALPPAPVVPAPPVTPPTSPAPATGQIRDTVAQVQSSVLSPQAGTGPQALTLSSTLVVVNEGQADGDKPRDSAAGSTIDTRLGTGASAPTLQIQNGGVQLPLSLTIE
jgi:filamentous hemagglutinin family protein